MANVAKSADRVLATLRRLPSFPVTTVGVAVVIIATVALVQDLLTGLVAIAMLVIGLWGSYVLGRESVGKSPPVRQSYRHLATLRAQLFALGEKVANDRYALRGHTGSDSERARMTLEMVEFVLGHNVASVGDAMEDWAELAPEEVEELRRDLLRETEAVRRHRIEDDLQEDLEDAYDASELVDADGGDEP